MRWINITKQPSNYTTLVWIWKKNDKGTIIHVSGL